MTSLVLTERPIRRLRILDFDLENRPLSYLGMDWTSAEVTAVGWSWVGELVVSTLLLRPDTKYELHQPGKHDEHLDARAAFELFRAVLVSADVVTGHYITKHDLPILNTMLMENGLLPLPDLQVQDTKWTVKVKDLSQSQENLASLFKMAEAKHHMTQSEWREANRLTVEGLAGAQKRVVDDVLQHKALREELITRGLLGAPKTWKSRK